MAVRIRLTRKGRKKQPFYRIVVADSQAPRDGKFLDIVGTYDPIPIGMNKFRKGVKPSDLKLP